MDDPKLIAAIIATLSSLSALFGAVKLYFKAKADNESATRHRKQDHEDLDSRVKVLETECRLSKAENDKRFAEGERRFEKQEAKLDRILEGVDSMRQEFSSFKGYVSGLEAARKEARE